MTRLQVRSLTVRRAERLVLDRVDFDADQGVFLGLLGPNGAGKTTLVKAMAGVLDIPFEGSATIDGTPLALISPALRARTVAYLSQGIDVSWPLRVRDIVILGRLPHHEKKFAGGIYGRLRRRDQNAVAQALRATDMEALADRPFFSLSGGEKARALLARTLAVEAEILLADEPVAHLDPAHQFRVLSMLKDEARRGRAVVAVLHDVSLAARLCDCVVVLDEGRVVVSGPPEEALSDDVLTSVFGISAVRGVWQGRPYLLPWMEISPQASRRRV